MSAVVEREEKASSSIKLSDDDIIDTTMKEIASMGYQIKNKLCKTSQGSIWRGIKSDTLQPVIIKIASKALVDSGAGQLSSGVRIKLDENITNEANMLKQLTQTLANYDKSIQDAVVKYIDFTNNSHNYCLIMSDGGQSLRGFVETCHEYIFHEKLDTKQWLAFVKKVFQQIIGIMNVLYNELMISHLDISLENILINDVHLIENEKSGQYTIEMGRDFNVSLCDFGLAQKFEKNSDYKCDKFVGKRRYCSPELFLKKKAFNARANDVWSIGVCLFIALIGWSPYNSPSDIDYQFRLIINGKIYQLLMMMNKLYLVPPDALDLLQSIFKYEKDRISLSQIQRHSFLNEHEMNQNRTV